MPFLLYLSPLQFVSHSERKHISRLFFLLKCIGEVKEVKKRGMGGGGDAQLQVLVFTSVVFFLSSHPSEVCIHKKINVTGLIYNMISANLTNEK